MTESTKLLLPSVDAYLGPSENRFFGAGYRRPTHTIADIAVTSRPDGTGSIAATAAVTYPKDWSRKGAADQPPHLSTVDVIVLGEQLAALYLQAAFGISPSDPDIEALGTIRISAGSTPVENELSGFPVEASTVSTTDAATPTVVCTTFDCTIANLRLIVSLQHARGEQRCTTIAVPDTAGSPGGLRPFAAGWADRGNTSTNIVINRDTSTASAQTRFTASPSWLPRPQDLVIDAFVVALQLGQILLYELDHLDRADSNTLWMRQTEIRWAPQHRGAPIPTVTTTTIANPRILNRGADRWRVADIRGDVYGVTVRCAVAHHLP